MFAALDLATGQLFYRFRDRKRWREFLEFLPPAAAPLPDRAALPDLRQLLPHHKAEVRTWCAAHDIELVFTPTYASWLNWIEAEFTALRYFALDGSDYPSHAEQKPRSPATSAGATDAPTQTALRGRLKDPYDRLPAQRCVTRH